MTDLLTPADTDTTISLDSPQSNKDKQEEKLQHVAASEPRGDSLMIDLIN